MTSEGKVEKLAAHCHDEQWSGWMKYLFSKCVEGHDYLGTSGYTKNGSLVIPRSLVERWKMQMNTPYSELPEEMRESDREEARAILVVVDSFLEGS